MKNSILLTHVFVEQNESYKLDIIDLCVEHFRKHNPDDFIVITGHGLSPRSDTLDRCDAHYWEPDIIRTELNVGHPKLVNAGFDILLSNGFKTTCKARIDAIHPILNITKYCDDIITEEKTKKLITTTNNCDYHMGDLFTYGSIEFLKECWRIDTWYPTNTGLRSLGKNFVRAVGGTIPDQWDPNAKLLGEKTWHDLLVEHTSYRSPETLKWVDFRRHWSSIMGMPDYREKVLNNDFDYSSYIWIDWPQQPDAHPYTEGAFYGSR